MTGGEAALLERLRRAPAVLDPRQLRARRRRRRGARRAAARRRARRCGSWRTSQVALEVDGEAVFELAPLALDDAVELFTRRAARPGRATRSTSCAARSTACRSRSSSPRRARGRCRSRRSPAGSTTASACCSDPASRKPRAPPGAEGDDRLELRAAVPRRPARPVGARDVHRRRAAGGRRVRARGARRAGVGGDRRRRPAREPLARDRRRRAATGCSTASARSRSRRWREAGLRDAASTRTPRWYAAAAARLDRGRAQRAPGRAPGVRARRAREHRRRAGLERGARPAARAGDRERLRLGVDRARRQPRRPAAARPRSTPPATRRRRATGPTRCCSRRGSRRRSGDLEPARRHIAAAAALADDADARGALRLLPRLRRLPPRRLGARAGADRARTRSTTARPPVGPGGQRAVRRARGDLGRRRARAPRPRATRSSTGCEHVDDPWLHVRRDAMLGELARVEHRFDDAVDAHRPRGRDLGPARLPADRGLPALEPRPRAVPGRRLRGRRGDARARRSARPRRPATCAWPRSARVHLGRVLRALGRTRRGAGGARGGRRVPPRCRRRRAGSARRLPAGGARRATARRLAGAARGAARRRATTTRRSRCSRSTRSAALTGDDGARRAPPTAHGGRLALHHRARPGRPPRWCSTTNASSPPMTIAMPAACRPLITSPSSR